MPSKIRLIHVTATWFQAILLRIPSAPKEQAVAGGAQLGTELRKQTQKQHKAGLNDFLFTFSNTTCLSAQLSALTRFSILLRQIVISVSTFPPRQLSPSLRPGRPPFSGRAAFSSCNFHHKRLPLHRRQTLTIYLP